MASAHIGSKVQIKLIEGDEFSGFVHSVDGNTGKLTLDKVILFGSEGVRRRIHGLQHFYGNEIVNIVKCEEVCPKLKKNASTVNEMKSKDAGSCLRKLKEKPKHLQNQIKLETEKLLLSSKSFPNDDTSNIKSRICSSAKSSDYDSSSDLSDSYNDQESRYHLINSLDDQFYDAMAYLNQQSIIALSFEGVEIGREGTLAWISVASKDDLILFDVLSLGAKCFSDGFRDILESQNVLKVIHDCRFISDLLYHQHLIKLVNIFDTQVADVIIHRLRNKDWPRYVSGLSSCLFSHLELSPEQVHIMRVRESSKKEDQQIWCQRPAPNFVREAAIKHVEHLLDLRLILMEKMMTEFTVGVDIYLAQVKDMSDVEAKRALSSCHLLPFAFQHFNQFLHTSHFNYTMPIRMRNTATTKDRNGFSENCIGILDPDVIASVDAIWHRGINKKCPGFSKKRSHSEERNTIKEKQTTCSTDSDKETDVKPLSDTVLPSSHDSEVQHENKPLSLKRPEYDNPVMERSTDVKTKTDVLKSSQSLTSLKIGETKESSESELSGSELLKELMEKAQTSARGKKTADYVIRPAGRLCTNVPRSQKNSHNSANQHEKPVHSVSESESSACSDDYFGDIPFREYMKRDEQLSSQGVPLSPQHVINEGCGKPVTSLSSSDSDFSEAEVQKRFEFLEKQSKSLHPLLPSSVGLGASNSYSSSPYSSNEDGEEFSSHDSAVETSSKQQTAEGSPNDQDSGKFISSANPSSSISLQAIMNKSHTSSSNEKNILTTTTSGCFSTPSTLISLPSGIGRGIRCKPSNTISLSSTTSESVGRGRSPVTSTSDTPADHTSPTHFPYPDLTSTPNVYQEEYVKINRSGGPIKISPYGRGVGFSGSFSDNCSPDAKTVQPLTYGRGIRLSN